jgi:hypothetical protein
MKFITDVLIVVCVFASIRFIIDGRMDYAIYLMVVANFLYISTKDLGPTNNVYNIFECEKKEDEQ